MNEGPVTYYEGRLAVAASWMIQNGLIKKQTYDKYVWSGKFVRLRRGGRGRSALIDFERMPGRWREAVERALGTDPYMLAGVTGFENKIRPDYKAREFFAEALKFDRYMDKKLPKLVHTAEILNTVIRVYEERYAFRRKLGGSVKDLWAGLSAEVNAIDRNRMPHMVPRSKDRLRKRVKEYKEYGYAALLHGNRGKAHNRKRNEQLDYLICSLAAMQTKPYDTVVWDMYRKFRAGTLQVVDKRTGELFDHTDPAYTDISVGTVWNIVNENKDLISRIRDGQYHHKLHYRPHHHRSKPRYSLSKISMDDRDIMHVKIRGGGKVMAYYVFDTMSEAVIGYAHSKRKDERLFIEAVRSMFRFLHGHGIGIPMEAEVENHLVKNFKETLMTLFPIVRWSNPANPQEKWAETGIRLKKYGVEKLRHIAVGRHYARSEKNKVTRQKIYDETNEKYKEREATYEEIVAWDIEDIAIYNNELHSDQKRFPGKTRMEVLLENVNPDLPAYPGHLLALYAGAHVETSIRRNQYVRVAGENWMLESTEILDRLKPGRPEVDAYILGDGKVYLYQDGRYVGAAIPMPYYNTARGEWTEEDEANYKRQSSYVAQYDKRIKERKEKVARLDVVEIAGKLDHVEVETVEDRSPDPVPVPDAGAFTDYAKRGAEEV